MPSAICRTSPLVPCSSRTPTVIVHGSLRYFSKLPSSPARPAGLSASSTRFPAAARRTTPLTLERADSAAHSGSLKYHGVHHVALLVSNLERSLDFYEGVLGLEINPDRPHNKLPYRGAWLWIGPEMIHLMELENPDPMNRPEHGGRDRHFCVGVNDIQPLVDKLTAAGVKFTMSMSGRRALFFRDPDMNTLEIVEQEPWR